MSIANFVISDTFDREARRGAVADRPAAGSAEPPRARVYSLPADRWSRAVRAPTGEVREEGEYYVPDPREEDDYEPDPELLAAADERTEGQREAMALLDDAENLLAVLMAALEEDGDDRAGQAEAVLKIVRKKLGIAHTRIDRQERLHRNLFLAYFELEARSETEAD